MTTILSIPIDNVTMNETVNQVSQWIASNQSLKTIATINPEMIMAAQSNRDLMQAIIDSDLKVADAMGILWAAKKHRQPLNGRVPGVDLVDRLAQTGLKKGWRWYLLGAAPGVAKQAANKLKQKYPGIIITKAEDGGVITLQNISQQEALVKRINDAKPNIFLVSLGVPKQELFLKYYKNKLHANVGIGVGGTLDFISGKQKRAPKLLRFLGLEWLWRLIREPRRFKRIWTAVVSYPLAVKRDLKIQKI